METKKYQLPKEFATKWVEALRSGHYSKSRFKLYRDGGYCCLGVACAISGFDEVLKMEENYDSQFICDQSDSTEGLSDLAGTPILSIIPIELQLDNGMRLLA